MAEETKPQNPPNVADVNSTGGEISIQMVTIKNSRGQTTTLGRPLIVSLDIYESLFSPFVVGQIVLMESSDLASLLPLIGEETIQIQLVDYFSKTYDETFLIYKMGDRVNVNERSNAYALHFMSYGATLDLNTKLGRSFKGPIDSIAKDIIGSLNFGNTSIGKQLNIEATSNNTMFISNFWRPSRCMQFICDQAQNINGSPSYMFFETKSKFNFVSLDSMYGASNFIEFEKSNYFRDVRTQRKNVDMEYKQVLALDHFEPFNYIDRLTSGMYGSKIVYHDITTGQHVNTSYTPNWENRKNKLNDYPLWSVGAKTSSNAVLIRDHQHYNNFTGFGSDTSNTKVHQERLALIAQAQASRCAVTVFGKLEYEVGMKVKLTVPRSGPIDANSDPRNKYVSGYYIIASLRHKIGIRHQCDMELIKDSYMVDLEK